LIQYICATSPMASLVLITRRYVAKLVRKFG